MPTRLKFDAGAGSFDVDLSALAIVEASSRWVRPGRGSSCPGRAARSRRLDHRRRGIVRDRGPARGRIPFESSGGLTSVDGLTQSAGYGTAADRVLVRFTGGASSVRIG